MRTILGFAVLAVIGIVVLKLAFGLLGALSGLIWFVLKLALVGVLIYWVLKLIAPSTARRVEDMIRGQKAS